MNLQEAHSLTQLQIPVQGITVKTRTKLQVAKRVFTLAAAGGFPYTGMSFQDWAKKWLTSDTYRLMEIDINAAASPHLPKNPERVAFRLLCATDSVDPIVVDLNKQKTGKSHLGYIPKVVVLDGKHRKQAQMLQGHTKILAWVGCRAEKYLTNKRVIDHLDFTNVKPSLGSKRVIIQAAQFTTVDQFEYRKERLSLETSFNLHCATVPATGSALLDQSGGEKGSRPRDAVVQAGKGKCPHCGSKDFSLMPTDFETAKCKKCGKNFQVSIQAGGPGSGRHPGNLMTQPRMAKIEPYTHATAKPGELKMTITQGDKFVSSTVHPNREHAEKAALKHKAKIGAASGGGAGGPGASLGGGSGSNPPSHVMRGKKMKARDCNACAGNAPFSMGQLEEPSASDGPDKTPKDEDEASFVSPSDQRQYLYPRANIKSPGDTGWETEPGTLVGSNLAPFLTKSTGATNSEMSKKYRSFKQGTGTGPTLGKNTGATRSEMSRLANTVPGVGNRSVQGKGKMVRRIFTKSPPGMEAMVLALKKKYGEDSPKPFQIAWAKYQEGK